MSLLMHAVQALYVNDAAVGVVGIEFLYDSLATTLKKIGCGPGVGEFLKCLGVILICLISYTDLGEFPENES
jgi:hypothetical protein